VKAGAAVVAAPALFSGAKYTTIGLLIPSIYPCAPETRGRAE
jgi:hypothetical protein